MDLEALLKRASALSLVEEIAVNFDNGPTGNDSIKVRNGERVAGVRKNEKHRKKKSEQYLKYLIVIDFEATCWKERRVSPNEIIGKPWTDTERYSIQALFSRISRLPLQFVHTQRRR